jgi:hypothetical protein
MFLTIFFEDCISAFLRRGDQQNLVVVTMGDT